MKRLRLQSTALILPLLAATGGCASPGSVSMSRYNTSYEQTKADWDDCVERVRFKDSDPTAQLARMMGESLWGAPFTKECMRDKGYRQD